MGFFCYVSSIISGVSIARFSERTILNSVNTVVDAYVMTSAFSIEIVVYRGRNGSKDISLECGHPSKGEMDNVEYCIKMNRQFDALDKVFEAQI